ncbi:MAG: hypothetical protein IT328_04595 [Caldilineaceae bacterium]|nr:hypothetical protein [Caldilineaceae bacterium]
MERALFADRSVADGDAPTVHVAAAMADLGKALAERDELSAAPREAVPGFRRADDPRIPAGYRRRVLERHALRRRR